MTLGLRAGRGQFGSRFLILTMIDEYTRERLAIDAAWKIRAVDVIMVVEAAIQRFGAPEHIRSDVGSEVNVRTVQKWPAENRIKTIYTEPGPVAKRRCGKIPRTPP